VDFTEGYADVVGHEGGRKHPRRVWLNWWIVAHLKAIRDQQGPPSDECCVWPFGSDLASDDWKVLRAVAGLREVTFNDLRRSWVTQVHENGMSAEEESAIGGHSPEVAAKHYNAFTAKDARNKLPADPLTSTCAS
jgi:hypothetical protein